MAFRESPIRYIETDDPRLPRRLDAVLREQMDGLKLTVLQGQLEPGEYKFYTGQIQGLQMALDQIEQIIKEL